MALPDGYVNDMDLGMRAFFPHNFSFCIIDLLNDLLNIGGV